MDKKILIVVGIIIVILGLAWYFFLLPKCPKSCDDNNSCTTETCSKETSYKCKTIPVPNCCGNKICETKENYEACAVDCPNCDDGNECTKDSYDYHEQKCINAPVLNKVCCGNTICEPSETYGSCVLDCPNCDDNSRLTADNFNYSTQKCTNTVTHYFIDDFESGTSNWNFGGEGGTWTAIKDGSNMVLKGVNHNWAELRDKGWDNFGFKARFKIIKGDQHFNYRIKQEEGNPTRYFVYLGSGNIVIAKQIKESFFSDLARADNLKIGGGWHSIEIRGYGNIINVLVDGALLIKYKDTSDPVLSGTVGFETLDNSEFLIDDVEIKVITSKDVFYP